MGAAPSLGVNLKSSQLSDAVVEGRGGPPSGVGPCEVTRVASWQPAERMRWPHIAGESVRSGGNNMIAPVVCVE